MYISQDPIGLDGGDRLYGYVGDVNGYLDVLGLARGANKLKPDPNAVGSHSTFGRDNNGRIFKYETYEKTPSGHFDPVKRFDGGMPDGNPGVPHRNKQNVPIETPHVQGKGIPDGVRRPTPDELPNNNRFRNTCP